MTGSPEELNRPLDVIKSQNTYVDLYHGFRAALMQIPHYLQAVAEARWEFYKAVIFKKDGKVYKEEQERPGALTITRYWGKSFDRKPYEKQAEGKVILTEYYRTPEQRFRGIEEKYNPAIGFQSEDVYDLFSLEGFPAPWRVERINTELVKARIEEFLADLKS